MSRKLTSLLLLVVAFLVGIASADYSALAAGQAAIRPNATVAIVMLLAAGVYGWYRIVKSAAEEQKWNQREMRWHGR